MLAFAAGCASAGGSPRALAISDADRQAKDALAGESRIDPARIPARAMGILPFTVAARDTLLQPLGYALAEFLSTDLSRSPDLQLVDRLRTDAILRELALADNGAVDPSTAPRVGKLVGARRLLIGSVTTMPDGQVAINARVVDVLAGTVENVLSASAPLERVIDAEKALALRVFENIGITLTPAQQLLVEQRQTTNLAATVAYGKGLQAEAKGDVPGAAAAFEEAVRFDVALASTRGGVVQSGGPSESRNSSSAASRIGSSGIQRVLDLSADAINAPVSTKLPEAVDVPLSGQTLTFLVTVRVF